MLPMEQINLHFTGDLHAANLGTQLLIMIDNHIKHGNAAGWTPRIGWPRVVDLNDRALREVVVGLGGAANGHVRQDRFDITAASEVMAILVLARDYADLRARLGEIVGPDLDGNPVRADDLEAAGAMALPSGTPSPNLVQTSKVKPTFIHGGPFANIAHGNSSVIGDRLALACADFVVTEAGFDSDMGAEKFCTSRPLWARKPPTAW